MTKPNRLYVIDEEVGVLDEVQGWFLALADNEGWVYTSALRQLVNRMYRDYQEKRTRQGRHTAYDYALDRDQKALAWAIRALVFYVPGSEKEQPEPPKKPRQPSRRLSPAQRKATAGRPSWNYTPKRGWRGPDLPQLPHAVGDAAAEEARGSGGNGGKLQNVESPRAACELRETEALWKPFRT